MAYCPKCGAKLPDGAKFCGSCGSKVATPSAPAAPSQSPAVPSMAPTVAPVTPSMTPKVAPAAPSVPSSPAPAPTGAPGANDAPQKAPSEPDVSWKDAFAYFQKPYVAPTKLTSDGNITVKRRDNDLNKPAESSMGELDYSTHEGGSSTKISFGQLATGLIPEAAPLASMISDKTRAEASKRVYTDRLKNQVSMGEISQEDATEQADAIDSTKSN